MREKLTADSVLNDIEFELAQGLVSHGDLAQGIQAVTRYQNQIRGGMDRGSRRMGGDSEIINHLFQINDMLITLLHETALAIESLRTDLRKVNERATGAGLAGSAGEAPSANEDDDKDHGPKRRPTHEKPPQAWDQQKLAELENAMRSEALEIRVGARPVRIPLIGHFLWRLRDMFHGLVAFYVKRLAERQTIVNQTYGGAILRLTEINQRERERVRALSDQLAALQDRLEETEAEAE